MKQASSFRNTELSVRAKRCIVGRNVEDGEKRRRRASRQVRAGPSSRAWNFREGLPFPEYKYGKVDGDEGGRKREGDHGRHDGADQERNLSHEYGEASQHRRASRSHGQQDQDLLRHGPRPRRRVFSKIGKAGRLKEDVAILYFQQLISAVDFCHSRGVYHRDLKPENLLLDEHGNLKVTDFGLSAFSEHLKQDGLLHTTCGTPAYVAPEVIGKKGYDGAKADLWSCGVVLYVLLAGFLPFQDDNLVSMYRKIYKANFKCPPWFSFEAKRLVTKLLDPNPLKRISIVKIMETSWFKKSIPNAVLSKKEQDFDQVINKTSKQMETLNAFHIISLSEGFDLSPLFEEKKREEKEEMRFATTRSASSVIQELEEVGKAGRFKVKKSDSTVRLQGKMCSC